MLERLIKEMSETDNLFLKITSTEDLYTNGGRLKDRYQKIIDQWILIEKKETQEMQ
jgi:hypothetical protein